MLIAEDEDSRDMALFRHSTTVSTRTNGDSDPKGVLPDQTLSADDLEPVGTSSILPASSSASRSTAHLRHLCVSEHFREMAKVDGYLLKMSINAAFSQSTANSAVDEIMLCLDPSLDKGLRSAALDSGFKIVGSTKLDIKSDIKDAAAMGRLHKIGDILEALLRRIWPLSFTQEILLLRRQDADKALIQQ